MLKLKEKAMQTESWKIYLIYFNFYDTDFLTHHEPRDKFLTNFHPRHDWCESFRCNMLPNAMEQLSTSWKLYFCPKIIIKGIISCETEDVNE